LQFFYQFPQKIDILASNVTAISLCQKIRQNKNSNENGIFGRFKIAVSLQAETGCKTCKSKTNPLILDELKQFYLVWLGLAEAISCLVKSPTNFYPRAKL
jgi:hypothetical protein